MKIIKDKKTALLLKSFLLNNQDYLSISVLCYFDFNNPNLLLDEQAMYKESSLELGKTILDSAMPKPCAEILLCGSCHNPFPDNGTSHVKLKVGSIAKELYVFGKRTWSNGGISKPLAFQTIPLDIAHATAIDENHLPYIEDPSKLTTTTDEKKEPATFLPKEMFTKKNMKKLGTHDEKWKRELWPGFAADMDYSFFNLAPKDQQQDGFFKGSESIQLVNMHPKHSVINSKIPDISMRCFATKTHKDKEDEFVEVKLQRDTLWLFPEIQRGIVIFRGTIPIADEIYSNLKYLNLKPVESDGVLKSIQEYYALQKKELDKSVEFDETPFEEADAKIKEAKKEVFDIPRQVKEGVKKTQGKRPTLKRTSAEKVQRSHARIDKAIKRMDDSKKKLQEMKDEFGHITKIDVDAFESVKADLLVSKDKIANTLAKVDSIAEKTQQMKLDTLADIEVIKKNPNITDDIKKKLAFDFLEPKEKVWSDYAFEFLSQSVKDLEKEPEELHKLRHLGLAKRTIPRAWIGFNTKAKTIKADDWNLDSEDDIELPKGLVTARFKEATLKSLRIGDIVVLGSDEDYELFLNEENYNFPLFYLKNEIEAHLCDQEAFDICNSLVCDDISSVGDKTKEALENASVVFYLQKDGVIDKLPNSKEFDCGEYENLFELHQNGVEIREQIIENLPKGIEKSLPLKRDISVKTINLKSKKITDKVKYDLKAKTDAYKIDMQKHRDAVIQKANKVLLKRGLKPIDISASSSSAKYIKPSDIADSFDKAISLLRKQDARDGIDIKDKIVELEKAKEKLVALAEKGEVIYKKGMVKIAQAKEKAVKIAKNPLPQWAKIQMQEAGIDPQNPHDKLTREKVIDYHAKGKSFNTKNLSKLDLSELDLQGIDLTMANCKETNFKGTNLSDAIFEQTNCKKTDFTYANLSDANASMSIFKESVFDKTNLDGFVSDMALFEKLSIKDSSFKDANLDGVVFQEVSIINTSFQRTIFINSNFLKSSIQSSVFDSSTMKVVLFSESSINKCDLIHIDSTKMLFNKSHIVDCDFSHSRLHNTRILKESSFSGCNLSSCDMQNSTIYEVSLSDCSLVQTNLTKSLIKKAKLDRCDFRGVIAKQGRFEFSTFKESTFVGIDLLRGSLRRMNLQRCDFSHSNLYAVEMYKTELFKVNFNGANLKKSNLEGKLELIND